MSEITEKEYRALKAEVEDAKSAADKARGAMERDIETLKEEFSVDSLKEAKAKLTELTQAASEAQKKFEAAFKEYQKNWKVAKDEDDGGEEED